MHPHAPSPLHPKTQLHHTVSLSLAQFVTRFPRIPEIAAICLWGPQVQTHTLRNNIIIYN